MVSERERHLSNDVLEADVNITKVRVLLSELLNEYDFDGDHPEERMANKIMFEARKIMTFIGIINDYIFEVKNGLERVEERFKLES